MPLGTNHINKHNVQTRNAELYTRDKVRAIPDEVRKLEIELWDEGLSARDARLAAVAFYCGRHLARPEKSEAAQPAFIKKIMTLVYPYEKLDPYGPRKT